MNYEEQVDVTKIVVHTTEASTGDSVAVIALIVTIALAVIGWGVSNWLQQKNHKQEKRAKINYEIYSQLVLVHKDLQDAIGSFNAATSPPIIQMRADLVPYEVQQQYGVGRYPKIKTPFLKSFDNTRVHVWQQTAAVSA